MQHQPWYCIQTGLCCDTKWRKINASHSENAGIVLLLNDLVELVSAEVIYEIKR